MTEQATPTIAEVAEEQEIAEEAQIAAERVANRSFKLMTVVVGEILSIVRTLPKEWARMSEREQKQVQERARHVGERLVTDLADLMGSRGFDALKIKVTKAAWKPDITQCFFEIPTDQFMEMGQRLQGALLLVTLGIEEWLAFEPMQTDNVGELAMPREAAQPTGYTMTPCHEPGQLVCMICGLGVPKDGEGDPVPHDPATGEVQPTNGAPPPGPYGEGDPAEIEGT